MAARSERAPRGYRPSRRTRRGVRSGEGYWALLFIGPIGVGLAIFYFWPIARTAYLSFTSSGAFGGGQWIGLKNYKDLFQDPEVLSSLRNSALYALMVLAGIPIAIVISAMLNTRRLRGGNVYRVFYFLPVVTLPAAVALIWKLIYNSDYGLLNSGLGTVGIRGPQWLTDPHLALVALAAVGIWSGIGTQIIIFLAGLRGIPNELYEAAELDGASGIRRFFSVTLPLLTPSIFFVSVLSVISSMQMFDLAFLMISPTNPAFSSGQTIVYLFYEEGFVKNDRGYAAAIAVVLFVVILLLTAGQFRLQRRWVFYG